MANAQILSAVGDKVDIHIDGNATIKQAELALTDNKGFASPTLAFVGGSVIGRKDWDSLQVSDGDLITFCALPGVGGGQGGSNPLQIVMMIGVMIASVYTGGAVAGLYFAAQTAAYAATQVLVSTAVMMLGSMLVNAIFPTDKPSGLIGPANAESSSPTYNLNGASNQARLYQPVPELFGEMRVVPDVIGTQWTQYINNEMYLYQLYGLGRGDVEIKDMRFGDVAFWRDGDLVPDSPFATGGGATQSQKVGISIPVGYNNPLGSATYTLDATDRSLTVLLYFPDGICTYTYYGEGVWLPTPAEINIDVHAVAPDGTDTLISEMLIIPSNETYKGHHNERRDLVLPAGDGPYGIYFVGDCDYPDTVSVVDNGVTVTKDNGKTAWFDSYTSTGPAVEIEIVEPGQPVTLYPTNVDVSRDVASQDFVLNQALGPYPVCAVGTVTDTILFSFIFPQGLGVYSNSGGLWEQRVTITAEIQYIDDNNVGYGPWYKIRDYWYLDSTSGPLRYTESATVTPGRYQVRCTMSESVNGVPSADVGEVMDSCQWQALVAIIPGESTYPQKAVAIKLRATQASSQAQSAYSCLLARKLPLYDIASGTWSVPQETRSPAAAICSILKSDYGGQLADANIDLDALWGISNTLEAGGWHFDAWIDGAYEVYQLILEICDALAMAPRITGPNVSFVLDSVGRQPKHVFTPRDIVRGSLQLTYNTYSDSTPDDMIVDYLDRDADYLQRDVRAALPDSESSKPFRQQYLGITSRKQAFERARWAAACNRWRRLGCHYETEGIGRLLNVGDVISITHPRLSGGYYSTVLAFDDIQLQITVDKPIQIGAGNYVSVNTRDGKLWGPVAIYQTATPTTILQVDANDYASVVASQGTLANVISCLDGAAIPSTCVIQTGEDLERRYIVTAVVPVNNYRFGVDCINDDPRVGQYQDLPVPPWQG